MRCSRWFASLDRSSVRLRNPQLAPAEVVGLCIIATHVPIPAAVKIERILRLDSL